MTIHYKSQGFIFKKEDRGESDRVFTFFTKDFGKLEILAKAERKIKSKLRGGLELFYLTDIEFIQGKTHKTLTDVFLINNFRNIRKDLKRLVITYQIGEVLDKLLKGEEKDERIWYLILETFKKLDSSSVVASHWSLIYHYFFWNFFSTLGYQPEVYFCCLCQKKLKPENLYFSFKEGGIICNLCVKKLAAHTQDRTAKRVDEGFIKILRIILKKDWSTLSRLKIGKFQKEVLENISRDYLSFISG